MLFIFISIVSLIYLMLGVGLYKRKISILSDGAKEKYDNEKVSKIFARYFLALFICGLFVLAGIGFANKSLFAIGLGFFTGTSASIVGCIYHKKFNKKS